MALPLPIAALVLLAAVLHAAWNALVKSSGDRLFSMVIVIGVGAVLALPVLPFVDPPAPESWPYLLLSTTIHVGYFFFLIQAYRVGDLSHVYPVARGATPLLVAAGGAVFVGETPTVGALAGLVLASLAIASFAFERGLAGLRDVRPFLYGFATALFISAYTLTDALGVRLSGSPLGFIAWVFLLSGLPLAGYALSTRRAAFARYARACWRRDLAGGLLAASAYALVIWAFVFGPVAFVSALRETSVVFAVLIGSIVLREPFGGRRALGAAVAAGGIAIMHLAG